ncbi:hypothetical protein TVAG_177170 [Trichomonas vaginalis G3]|uniref:Leucine Rich Repeat family protein n=1 Tax=Trichomonas vaginalis (strain ATCC PRA-98 / G3) TaxID=412133 RepID=A2F9U9_TRIV3|nr:ribonuclease inhibitor domain-containing protein [Trichomonas vaginalis G3]EAX98347.1 hypothetical protein TVAG_177170 [Trichomonas vaginalis G3]KAI5494562.1 ribonuclease inhibitor domain-containing protein [Trichomonas vaginalis G3]|eukprot:XP_001311277.1 hypothetical protein [Trichomonas vaginalis G3]
MKNITLKTTSRAHKTLLSGKYRQAKQEIISAYDRTIDGTTDYSNIGLLQLNSIEVPSTTQNLLLNGNPIKSLEGLGNTINIHFLNIDNTEFESFRNFPQFPNLVSISLSQTPITKNPAFKSGLIILIPSLKKINGELVTRAERKIAESFNEKTPLLLRNGWTPSLHPPNEQETYHILNRLLATRKIISSSRNLNSKECVTSQPAHTKTLRAYLDLSIKKKQLEIAQLNQQIEDS